MGTNDMNDEIEIDLREVALLLLRRFWIIALAATICAGVTMAYAKLAITPMYQSHAKLYVLSRTNEDTLTNADMQASTYLTSDFTEIVKSRSTAEMVILKNQLELTVDEFMKKITVSSVLNSRILELDVIDPDPENAKFFADEICEAAMTRVEEVTGEHNLNIIDKASLPIYPYTPNTLKDGAKGGFVGAALAIMVIVAMYLLDDKVFNEEDVEKYLNMSTLGSIPKRGNNTKRGKKKRTKKYQRRREDKQ